MGYGRMREGRNKRGLRAIWDKGVTGRGPRYSNIPLPGTLTPFSPDSNPPERGVGEVREGAKKDEGVGSEEGKRGNDRWT